MSGTYDDDKVRACACIFRNDWGYPEQVFLSYGVKDSAPLSEVI